MKDVAHHENVGARQRVVEKVSAAEAEAICEPVSGDVGAEDRLDGWEVEAAAGEVFVHPRDRDRDSALRTTDVDHAGVVAEWELLRDRLPRGGTEAAHRTRELRQLGGVGVERFEEVAAGLHLALRLPGSQSLGQRSPEPIQAGVRHLQNTADVRRLGRVEEQIGRRSIGVAAVVVTLEHPERHQRVEEVSRTAGMQPELLT